METIVIDGAGLASRAAVHDYLFARLGLPDYYGRNLDALYDCLTERPGPIRLLVRGLPDLEAALGGYAAALWETLEAAARENPGLEVVRQEEAEGR